jgi:gamma-glutamylcyclotransferase (GGCT)/AIG2-like uncharacterized protein YtfP
MRFFFYGTLMAGSDNQMARFVHARMRAIGPAETRGALHAVPDPDGWYPALLPGESVARGMLYEAGDRFTAADLARLDAYEDYDPAQPEASLYIREPLRVIGPDGMTVTAEAYRFARPLPEGSLPIPDGDFRVWLTEAGVAAFAGRRSDS